MAFSPEGDIWFSDGANSRIAIRSSRDLSVREEFRVANPLRSIVPAHGGKHMLAIPGGVQHMAVLVDRSGAQQRTVPFSASLAEINPIARERYLVRISDSLSVVQFRWIDARVALGSVGNTVYAWTGDVLPPEILTMPLDNKGSVGYRIAASQREFAAAVGVQGDTLLVVRGSTDERDHRRIVARYDARTGRLIDHVRLA